jgi:hypothetical protein
MKAKAMPQGKPTRREQIPNPENSAPRNSQHREKRMKGSFPLRGKFSNRILELPPRLRQRVLEKALLTLDEFVPKAILLAAKDVAEVAERPLRLRRAPS